MSFQTYEEIFATRPKLTLPSIRWKYDALKPYISGQINELHHKKHHQAYVDGFNSAVESILNAEVKNNVSEVLELQQNLKFHGGGYVNHILLFNNLSPTSINGGKPPTGSLAEKINAQYGSLNKLIDLSNQKLAGIQGSGWLFIVYNTGNRSLELVQRYNQDTVVGSLIPLMKVFQSFFEPLLILVYL